MRATASILLVYVFLGSLADFREWAKLPDLWEHFQEHRTKNADLALADFLFLHYGEGAQRHQQEEPERHQSLPFQTSSSVSVFTISPLPDTFSSPAPSHLQIECSGSYYPMFCSADQSASIWQPPRA